MKLIIDIPENVIEGAKSSPNYYPTYHFEKIWRAIANGTPYEERPRTVSREADRWIPVSERLPEEDGEYLVTREAYIDREHRNMIIVRDIAYFTINYIFNNGFHKTNTVIAWKPLPEPYKESEAEDE